MMLASKLVPAPENRLSERPEMRETLHLLAGCWQVLLGLILLCEKRNVGNFVHFPY